MSGTYERGRPLPLLLAGPILRRSEKREICVWTATSMPIDATLEIYELEGRGRGRKVGAGPAESVRLGRNLFVHLLRARADSGFFPQGTLLGYDIGLTTNDDQTSRFHDLGLLDGPHRITYDGMALPSLFLPDDDATALNVMHGSCRQLHGNGEDALAAVDDVVAKRLRDLDARPSALFLTGDQIYSDDVAGPLLVHLRDLGGRVMGEHDEVPGLSLRDTPLYGRAEQLVERANLTSSKADNHLASFSEFAAIYLAGWSPQCWPRSFAKGEDVIQTGTSDGSVAKLRRRYDGDARRLEAVAASLARVRRGLANVPTYMVFDDHDVTDDWNITELWKERVRDSDMGRRIIANALAAFWAFQGWGNDPDSFDDDFKRVLSEHLAGDGDEAQYEKTLWDFDDWTFVAPTDPPALCLDTRTMRAYDSPESGARLLGGKGRARAVEVAEAAGHSPGDSMVLVSPVPVCGLELQERRQKFLVGKVGPYEIDFEAWHSSLQGFVDFMEMLIEQLQLPWVVILSGDVHYGMTIGVRFTLRGKTLPISQLVSSSFKHCGTTSKTALATLGRVVRRHHERVGWCSPPDLERSGKLRHKLIERAVNTDEWAEEAPVMLHPNRARQLKIQQEPDFVESRLYVAPEEARSVLVGENNLGIVRIDDRSAEQVHLVRRKQGLAERRATLELRSARPPS